MRSFEEMNRCKVLKGIREIHTSAPPLPTLRAPRVHFVTINIWPRQISFDVCRVWTAHSRGFLSPPSLPPYAHFNSLRSHGSHHDSVLNAHSDWWVPLRVFFFFLVLPENDTRHNNTSPHSLNLIYFSSFLRRWLQSIPPSSAAMKRCAAHPSAFVKWLFYAAGWWGVRGKRHRVLPVCTQISRLLAIGLQETPHWQPLSVHWRLAVNTEGSYNRASLSLLDLLPP